MLTNRWVLALFCLAIAATTLPTAAMADRLSEVEAARMNARAGGPLNEVDADLLRRHGKLITGATHESRPIPHSRRRAATRLRHDKAD